MKSRWIRIANMRHLLILLIISLLTSCASVTQTGEAPHVQSLSFEKRVQILSQLNQWNANGAAAIQFPHEGTSLRWEWQQITPQNYTLNLFGPLGSSFIRLSGNAQHVLLETSNGTKFTAATPEALLEQQLGWQLPVSYLYDWIRGLPVPALPAQKSVDEFNHLSVLIQQDWRIEYLSYTSVHGMDLPNKIVLTHPAMKVKIIINQWQI